MTSLWGFEFRNLIVVGQRQKAPDVGVDEALAHHFRHFAFRTEDFSDPQTGQDALLVGVVGAHDHTRDAKVQEVEGGENGGFEVLANGDHGCVEVLDVLGHQGLFVGGVQGDREGHIFLEQLCPVRLGVERENFSASPCEGKGDLGAVAPSAKNGKS